MATRLYLTKRSAPVGAPRASRYPVSAGNYFAGDSYTYPIQGTEGISTRVPAVLPSYRMTKYPGLIGPRSNINIVHPMVDIQLISGLALGIYDSHYQMMAGAVFSMVIENPVVIEGSELPAGGFTENLKLVSWSGKVSYEDGSLGPGMVGCFPRIFYVWRPSTQSVVGVLAEALEALRPWAMVFSWGRTSDPFYGDIARHQVEWGGHFTWGAVEHMYPVAAQAGDLLCVEYWVGRLLRNANWGFLPWDPETYPGTVDGSVHMATSLAMPVGGDSDQPPNLTEAGGTYRSFIESTQDFATLETRDRPSPQCSVGF